jgi:hypothetical protein
MKYVAALVFGLFFGALIFTVGLIYNPFVSKQNLSPLTVTNAQTITVSFSGAATDHIVFTNDGDSETKPYPEKVLQLWERPIRRSTVMATVLRDGRNQAAGIGVKISSLSERTDLLGAKALVDSIWYMYLPGKGAFFVEQSENYWTYLRHVVIAAHRSSANVWKGNWHLDTTFGPGALNTAKVTAGSGPYAGQEMLGVESLTTYVYSVSDGPVSAQGRFIIELPSIPEADSESLSDDGVP